MAFPLWTSFVIVQKLFQFMKNKFNFWKWHGMVIRGVSQINVLLQRGSPDFFLKEEKGPANLFFTKDNFSSVPPP